MNIHPYASEPTPMLHVHRQSAHGKNADRTVRYSKRGSFTCTNYAYITRASSASHHVLVQAQML
jgi:hypothetical protein